MRSMAVTKIRDLLKAGQPVTLSDIRAASPELLPGQVSSSLCYLVRMGQATRALVNNQAQGKRQARKQVWQYIEAK